MFLVITKIFESMLLPSKNNCTIPKIKSKQCKKCTLLKRTNSEGCLENNHACWQQIHLSSLIRSHLAKKKMLNRLGQLALYSETFASANDHVLKNFFFHLIRIFTNL